MGWVGEYTVLIQSKLTESRSWMFVILCVYMRKVYGFKQKELVYAYQRKTTQLNSTQPIRKHSKNAGRSTSAHPDIANRVKNRELKPDSINKSQDQNQLTSLPLLPFRILPPPPPRRRMQRRRLPISNSPSNNMSHVQRRRTARGFHVSGLPVRRVRRAQ